MNNCVALDGVEVSEERLDMLFDDVPRYTMQPA